MRQSKASKATKRSARDWLERDPSVGPSTAKEELQWLEQTKDLSTVHMGLKKKGGGGATKGGFGARMGGLCGKRK